MPAATHPSLTTSVADQDARQGSLLNLYRRLIHLRKENDALAVGRLVPLTTGNAHVLAYLRRADDATVMVVASGVRAHAGPRPAVTAPNPIPSTATDLNRRPHPGAQEGEPR